MPPLVIISLLACVTIFFLGVYVYSKNPKLLLNRLFFFYCLAGAYGAFAGFNLYQAETLEKAFFWSRAHLLMWPLLIAFQLHFVLVFTESSRLLKNKLIPVLIYGPAIMVSFFNMGLDQFQRSPARESWGWFLPVPEATPLIIATNVWAVATGVFPLLLCVLYCVKQTDLQKRKHGIYVCMGIFMQMAWSIATQGVLPGLGIKVPSSVSVGILLGSLCFGYAILRHGLFILTPRTAADEILSTMSDGLLIVDTDQKIQAVNQAACRLLGYKEKELLYQPVADVFKKNGRTDFSFNELPEKLTASGRIDDVEVSCLTKAGKNIPVSLSASLIRDQAGAPQGVIYAVRDITERKEAEREIQVSNEALLETNEQLKQEVGERNRAEEALRESEKRYREIFNSASDAFLVISPDSKIIDVNPQACTMYGYSQEEFLNLTAPDLIHPDSFDAFKNQVDKTVTQPKGELHFELVAKRKDGSPINVDVKGAMFNYKGATHSLSMVRDITERKQAEEFVKQSELKYRTLFESSSDAILMLDRNGFFDCNKAALDIFGLSSQEELFKTRPHDLSPPTQPDGRDSATEARNHIETAYEKGSDFFEWVHKKPDGTLFTAEILLSMIDLGDKKVLQALARDITERKRAEEALRESETRTPRSWRAEE